MNETDDVSSLSSCHMITEFKARDLAIDVVHMETNFEQPTAIFHCPTPM